MFDTALRDSVLVIAGRNHDRRSVFHEGCFPARRRCVRDLGGKGRTCVWGRDEAGFTGREEPLTVSSRVQEKGTMP
eukprot:2643779-Rhodomonas_salina.1